MKKKSKAAIIVRIAILSLVVLTLSALLSWGLNSSFRGFSLGYISYKNAGSYEIGSGSVSAQNIRRLNINWIAGNLDITVYDGEVIIFTEPADLDQDDQLRYRVKDGTLTIQYCKSGWTLFNTPQAKDLTVQIPRDLALSSLDLDLVDTHASLQGITGNVCQAETVSGNLRFTDCSFHSLEADAVSGGLRFDGTLEELEFDGVSGSLDLTLAAVPREVTVDLISGDTELRLPADAAFSAELDSVSGSLSTTFPVTKRGSTYVCGAGGGWFEFDSVSGNVSIDTLP